MSDSLRILAIFLLVVGKRGLCRRRVRARDRTADAARARSGGRRQPRARAALDLMDHPVKFIGTVQIGITVFGIALGAVGQPLLTDYFDSPFSYGVAYALAFLILTYLSVTLGELVPKALALQQAEPITKMLSIPLELLQTIMKPFTWLLQVSANAVTRLFGVQPAPAGELAHTEEDIRHIVAASEDAGVIATTEEEMLYKVFDFADKEVHEVIDPAAAGGGDLDRDADRGSARGAARLALHALPRLPRLARRDRWDLHVRDLFSALHDRGIANVDLEELLRPAYIVPETKDLAALLAEFRNQNQHMAIVVDEYGAMQGIATLEDLLEEIVGEIEDEFDLPDESVERIDDTHVRIGRDLPDRRLQRAVRDRPGGRGLPTMAGIVFGELGRAPEVGDEVEIDGLALRVIEVEGSRIQRLEVEFRTPVPETEPVEE